MSARSSGYESKDNDTYSTQSDSQNGEFSGHESGDSGHESGYSEPNTPNIAASSIGNSKFKLIKDNGNFSLAKVQRPSQKIKNNIGKKNLIDSKKSFSLYTNSRFKKSYTQIHNGKSKHNDKKKRPIITDDYKEPSMSNNVNRLLGASIVQQNKQYVSSISNSDDNCNLKRDDSINSYKNIAEISDSFIEITGKTSPVIDIVAQNLDYVCSIKIGTKKSPTLESQKKKQTEQHKWISASMNDDRTKSSVPNAKLLKQNENYVTAINVGSLINFSQNNKEEHDTKIKNDELNKTQKNITNYASIAKLFGGERNSINFPTISSQPDSLVNEETLRMMWYGSNESKLDVDDEQTNEILQDRGSRTENNDLPNFSRVVYNKSMYSSLKRANSFKSKYYKKSPIKKGRSKSFAVSLLSRKGSAKKSRGNNSIKFIGKSNVNLNGLKLLENGTAFRELSSLPDKTQDLNSVMQANARRISRLDSNTTNESSQSRYTYEEVSSLEREYASQVSMDITLPKQPLMHQDNDNEYHNGYNGSGLLVNKYKMQSKDLSKIPLKSNSIAGLNSSQLEELHKLVNDKFQSAPLQHIQWLDLDEVQIEDGLDKQERRVTFGEDTYNQYNLKRNDSCEKSQHTLCQVPVIPIKLSELQLQSYGIHDIILDSNEGNSQNKFGIYTKNHSLSKTGISEKMQYRNEHWTRSDSYQSSYQDTPMSTLSRDKQHRLWESYYGTDGTIRTFPRALPPHPNSRAMCQNNHSFESIPHDFTLDMRRSEKILKRSKARKRRRRCYAAVLILLALSLFIFVTVAVSLYYSDGMRWFGALKF